MSVSIIEQFKPLFEPKTVAVVGASTRGDALPNVFIRRLREHGYAGAIYPIHPSAPAIEGFAAYRSLAESPQPVDYAYIAIAAAQVPPLLRGAGGRVRYGQVISSGFGEVDEGRELQEELVTAARAGGMRLLGPNCMGIYSPRGRVSFAEVAALENGCVGVLSQSGGLGTDIIRRGVNRGVKYSGLVTIGNCADLGVSDLLEFYSADPQTKVIGMYIETAKDGRRLFEILREAGAAKPVVILKGGRTRQGRAAAISHTGALAGDDRAWVAVSKQTVEALALLKLPPGTSITNPVDAPVGTLQQEDGRVAEKILEAIYGSGRPDALVMHLNLSAFAGRTKAEVLDNLVQAALRVQARYPGQAHFVLVLRSDGEPALEERKRAFRARAVALGIPVYDEIANAGRALASLAFHERFLATRQKRDS